MRRENITEGVYDRLNMVGRVLRQEALPDSPVYPVHPLYKDSPRHNKPHLALNVHNLVKALVCGSDTTFAMWPEWPVLRGPDDWDFKKVWVDLPDHRK